MVQNQIYTVSSWSQNTETRLAPTVNRKKYTGKLWNEKEVNTGLIKSATHRGQKSPAANEGQTLLNTAGVIVLRVKDNERHRLVGEKEWKIKKNQPKAVRADPILPIHHCLGKGASRFVGGRLSLDDSGDRWAQEILEISAKGRRYQ